MFCCYSQDEEGEGEEEGEEGGEGGEEGTVYLTCQEGTANKFYEMKMVGTDVHSRYGRIGSDGVTVVKCFSSTAEAQKFMDKTENEKTKKGYVHDSE